MFSLQCLPPCDETHYTASVSAAPFRGCSNKNLGLTSLCDLESHGDMAEVDPPIWGASVLRQYEAAAEGVPDYIAGAVRTNKRSYSRSPEVGFGSDDFNFSLLRVRFQINPDIFSASYDDASMTYDAYERDIALVTFYFDTDTVFEYTRCRHLIIIQLKVKLICIFQGGQDDGEKLHSPGGRPDGALPRIQPAVGH